MPFVSIPVPVQRRERRTNTSFSMPPSLARRVAAYAKENGLSASDFVTQLCASFLRAVEDSRARSRPNNQLATGPRDD